MNLMYCVLSKYPRLCSPILVSFLGFKVSRMLNVIRITQLTDPKSILAGWANVDGHTGIFHEAPIFAVAIGLNCHEQIYLFENVLLQSISSNWLLKHKTSTMNTCNWSVKDMVTSMLDVFFASNSKTNLCPLDIFFLLLCFSSWNKSYFC